MDFQLILRQDSFEQKENSFNILYSFWDYQSCKSPGERIYTDFVQNLEGH